MGVGERAQAVVIFLSGCIPQSQADRSPVDHHASRVVVETAVGAGVSIGGTFCRGFIGDCMAHTRSGCTLRERHLLCKKSEDMSRGRGDVNFSLVLGWLESSELTLPTAPSPVTTHCDLQLAGAFEAKLIARSSLPSAIE